MGEDREGGHLQARKQPYREIELASALDFSASRTEKSIALV